MPPYREKVVMLETCSKNPAWGTIKLVTGTFWGEA